MKGKIFFLNKKGECKLSRICRKASEEYRDCNEYNIESIKQLYTTSYFTHVGGDEEKTRDSICTICGVPLEKYMISRYITYINRKW